MFSSKSFACGRVNAGSETTLSSFLSQSFSISSSYSQSFYTSSLLSFGSSFVSVGFCIFLLFILGFYFGMIWFGIMVLLIRFLPVILLSSYSNLIFFSYISFIFLYFLYGYILSFIILPLVFLLNSSFISYIF